MPDEIIVSEDFRTMKVPYEQQVLGSYGDAWVRRVRFRAPRYCDGTDLSGYSFSVHFINNEVNEGYYPVTDLAVDGDELTFSWLVDPVACANMGITTASISATDVVDGEIAHRFSSTLYEFRVLPANDVVDESIIEQVGEMDILIASWRTQVEGAIANAEQATAGANDAAQAAAEITHTVQRTYEAAEAARQAAYEQAEADRDASLSSILTVSEGKLCAIYYQEV